ncbi:MAG: AAA family ATPase [Ignavibacteria bacterium]|nr:AAA family ATPase [Ignavibacteria bacterium]
MIIKKIELSNFKSFKELKLELGKFNVMIGPNSAGKSNLISIFRFLRDIVQSGLDNAISMQGGVEYLRNLSLGNSEKFMSLKIEVEPFKKIRPIKNMPHGTIGIKPSWFEHEFVLEFFDDNEQYRVVHNVLKQNFDFYLMRDSSNTEHIIGHSELTISNNNGNFAIDYTKDGEIPLSKEDLLPSIYLDINSYSEQSKLNETLFIENQYYMPHPDSVRKAIGDISIYDLDPNQPKSVTSIAGKAELEENGENLAIVLKRILSNPDKARTLFNLLQYLLPFIEEFEVDKFLDRYLQLKVKESYVKDKFLPASLMSSGSLFIIAIVIVLYFEHKKFVIFEEPARRIHPYLISKVIEMMKECSQHKQILLSTHNPEIVKYAGIENIHFVSRDEHGFSSVIKPHERNEIKTFLQNEIGIEELYIQNLLK